MKRVEIDEIRSLAERAEASGQGPLAGILYAVCGACEVGHEPEMLTYLVPFIQSAIEDVDQRLRAGQN